MGGIFSRPVGGTTPANTSNESAGGREGSPSSVIQGDVSVEPDTIQHGPTTRQGLMIDNTHSSRAANTSQFEISPSATDFSGHETSATTAVDNGGSLTRSMGFSGVPSSGHACGHYFGSIFPEIHPDTKKEVFRLRSFGEKQAVQIVCDSLLEVLRQAVASTQGSQDVEGWIMEPYEVIIHNKAKIKKSHSSLQDDIAKKHLEMFLRLLELHQPGAWQKYDEVQTGQCQQVLFKHLWLLYAPRTTVFKIDAGAWRAFVIEKTETVIDARETILRIHAWFLDFERTGDRLIPHKSMFDVPSFASEQPIRMLELIPEWFIKPTESFRQALMDRGRQHWSYNSKPSYQEYRGDAWPQGPRLSPLKVVVDYSTSTRCNVSGDVISKQESTSCCPVCVGESLGLFSYHPNASDDSHICINSVLQTSVPFRRRPEDEKTAFLYCPPRIWAFSLRFKTWEMVSHDHLDAVRPDESFENELFMDEGRKKPLNDIVSAYMSDGKFIGNDEALGRKGRGLNILLEGSPECLSRKFGVPLYTLSCGDLGLQSDVLDQRLLESFTRAANWNAMVLLDDVDIYGHDRSGSPYKRSVLVPTFLRHLEYSDCLTFISMDTCEEFDNVLQSRIHVTVPFLRFEYGEQQQIWQRFIGNLNPDSIDTHHLLDFVHSKLSGLDRGKHMMMNAWQIRNCIDVALALARKDADTGYIMQPKHIQTVLGLGETFRTHVLQEQRETAESNQAALISSPFNPLRSSAYR